MADNNKTLAALIKAGFVKKTIDGEDWLVIKSFRSRQNGTKDQEQEYAVKLVDILGSPGLGNYCDINMTPISITESPIQSFDVPGNPSQTGFPIGASVIVPGVLVLNRYDNGGAWYNEVSELGYSGFSPADTEWNSIYTDPTLNGFGDLSDVSSRTYGTFREACNFSVGSFVVGLELVCHIISTDQYFKFSVSRWDSGGGEGPYGGYAMTVQEFEVSAPCEIVFSDGSRMSSAPAAPEDLNTWNMPGVAFVSPAFGDDATAVVGDGNKPFRSIQAAQVASTTVHCLPGFYGGTITLTSATYHFYSGAVLSSGARLRDGGTTIDATITGHLVCGSFSYGLELTGTASKMVATIEEFDNVRSAAFATGSGSSLTVNAKRGLINCQNGAAYGCSARNGSNITLNFTEYCIVDFWLAANRDGGTFTINTPLLTTTANTAFGNIAKAIVNEQGIGQNFYNINVGVYRQLHPVKVSSFGVEDTALMLYVAATGAENSIFNFKGNFDAGVMDGLGSEYITTIGTINFEGTLRANEYFLDTWSRATAAASNVLYNFKNSKFEGGAALGAARIGAGRNVFFENCTIFASNLAAPAVLHYDGNNPGAGAPQVTFLNCSIEHINNGLAALSDDAGGVTQHRAANTVSSEALGAGVTEVWGGYTQLPGLTVSKIKLS